MNDEDAKLLKYAGMMGHAVVAIHGEPGNRRKGGEFNTLEQAKQHCGHLAHAIVYSTTGGKRRKWLQCWNKDMNELAEQVRTTSESKPLGP